MSLALLKSYANDVATTITRNDAELASQLRLSVMRLARLLRSQRPDTGLTLTQLATLGTLNRHGAMSPGELAAHERVRPPSMTRTLAVLEELGLVERKPHPTDGRQQIVAPTDQVANLLREDRRAKDAWLAQQLGQFDAEERVALRQVLPLLERLTTQ